MKLAFSCSFEIGGTTYGRHPILGVADRPLHRMSFFIDFDGVAQKRAVRFAVGSLTRFVEANLVRNTRAPPQSMKAFRKVLSTRRPYAFAGDRRTAASNGTIPTSSGLATCSASIWRAVSFMNHE